MTDTTSDEVTGATVFDWVQILTAAARYRGENDKHARLHVLEAALSDLKHKLTTAEGALTGPDLTILQAIKSAIFARPMLEHTGPKPATTWPFGSLVSAVAEG
jgi:hypothetical protein